MSLGGGGGAEERGTDLIKYDFLIPKIASEEILICSDLNVILLLLLLLLL